MSSIGNLKIHKSPVNENFIVSTEQKLLAPLVQKSKNGEELGLLPISSSYSVVVICVLWIISLSVGSSGKCNEASGTEYNGFNLF